MADNVKPTYSKTDVKSGLENERYADSVLEAKKHSVKKSVEEIEKVNLPGKAPGSVRS